MKFIKKIFKFKYWIISYIFQASDEGFENGKKWKNYIKLKPRKGDKITKPKGIINYGRFDVGKSKVKVVEFSKVLIKNRSMT